MFFELEPHRLAPQDLPVRSRELQRIPRLEHGRAGRAQRDETAERQQDVGSPAPGEPRQVALFPDETPDESAFLCALGANSPAGRQRRERGDQIRLSDQQTDVIWGAGG